MVDVEFAEFVRGGAGGLEGFLEGIGSGGVGGEDWGEEAIEEGVPGVWGAEDADGVDCDGEGGVLGDLGSMVSIGHS